MNISHRFISFNLPYIVLLLVCCTNTYSQAPAIPPPLQGVRLYFRAPDAVRGTLPQMRDAAYWVNKMQNPDGLVISSDKILRMNNAYQQRMQHPEILDTALARLIDKKLEASPGLIAGYPDLYSKTPAEVAELTKEMISKEIKYLRKGKYGDMMAVEYAGKKYNDLEAEMALTQVGERVSIKSGITVADARLRIIPAISPESVGITNKGKGRWDLWNLDIVPIGSPVQVLQVSKSGGSVFVLSVNGYGWINTEQVAFGDAEQIRKFTNAAKFALCTGDRVPFYTDANCTYASGWFRMGDCLPVAGNNPKVVQIPTRTANGNLSIQQAWLAADADVHAGYLPYTRKNIVVQTLKLLDNIYDWTGAWLGRNHATALRDIYACFGFKLPDCGELISAFNENVNRVYASEGREKEFKAMLANDPFVTLQICSSGHSQVYMGNYNGMPVSYDTNGYGYIDENNREVEIRRGAIVTADIPDYFLREDIIFIALK